MPLDPQAARLVAAARPLPIGRMAIGDLRLAYETARRPLQPPPESVASVEDHAVPGAAGPVGLRVYRPAGDGADRPLPVLLWLHGGGWTFGSLDGYDQLCRALANAGHCMVASVDYRLAPEHPFPAAWDDAQAALAGLRDRAGAVGADPGRIAVGGDSAGGTLAAVLALAERDAGRPLAGQVLVYPALDLAGETPSMAENGEGYVLTRAMMRWFIANYVPDPAARADWRVSPARADDLAGVAPAFVLTAEYDPLRDEGNAYAARLMASGVAVEHVEWPGMIHPFLSLGGALDAAGEATARIGGALRRAFAAPDP